MKARSVFALLAVFALVVGLFIAGSYAGDLSPNSNPAFAESASDKASLLSDQGITVYMNPACGCCGKWADHLAEAGFDVTRVEVDNTAEVRQQLGVPAAHASCHTGVIGDYVVEGHVPADVITKMLEEQPSIAGIAVGGMPMGSPGMEGPFTESYDIIAFDNDGDTHVYASR